MAYIIAIVVSLILFFGFLLLVRIETGKGTRVLGGFRERLDVRATRLAFVIRHVDWAAFLNHIVRSVSARVAHDLAHATLVVVRVLERMLTRFVKYLRSGGQQVAQVAHVTQKRKFSLRESLKQFRSTLTHEETREEAPVVPVIEEESKARPAFDIGKN